MNLCAAKLSLQFKQKIDLPKIMSKNIRVAWTDVTEMYW